MPSCTVNFVNNTPADWDVRIIEVGAHFFYQDEKGNPTRDWQTTKSANLDSGQSDSILSDDPNGCVLAIYAGCTAYVPGDGNKTFTSPTTGDKDHCILSTNFVLGPAAAISGEEVELSAALRKRAVRLYTHAEYEAAREFLQKHGLAKQGKK